MFEGRVSWCGRWILSIGRERIFMDAQLFWSWN